MTPRRSTHSSSPFYDREFADRTRNRKSGRLVPIRTRTLEQWICDRCGTKAEFPDEVGRTAFEVGWLNFDLGRSLKDHSRPMREKNEQVLCPACRNDLGHWFQEKVPT